MKYIKLNVIVNAEKYDLFFLERTRMIPYSGRTRIIKKGSFRDALGKLPKK